MKRQRPATPVERVRFLHTLLTKLLSMRLIATVAAVLVSIAAIITIQFPGAEGAFLAKVSNSGNSAASNAYFTCSAAVQGEGATNRATFAYPFGEASGTTAADVSGNGNTGAYSSTGVTYGVANSTGDTVCARDKKTVITLNGSTGYAVGPTTAVAGPTTFTIEIWFRTTTGGGKLIGFGDVRNPVVLTNPNALSANYDRHLYLDATGHVYFGVYPGSVKVIQSTGTYLDGKWHQAVATLAAAATSNGAPKGMALYIDGKQVATDATTTTAQSYNGYWRIGYDSTSGWTNASGTYFKGDLAFAAAYNSYALSPGQVATHFAAGD